MGQASKQISKKDSNEAIFRDAPVWKAILSTSVPSIFSMLVMILYNMADMFFVGQLGDPSQVAAVSLVSPIYSILMAIASMVSSGGCTLLARALGQGNQKDGKLYVSLIVWGSIILGIVFAAVLLPANQPVLHFLGVNDEIVPYAKVYLCVLSIGAPAMIFTTALGGAVRAEGAIKVGLLSHMLSTICNILLDPLFVLYLRMGVGGAAVATVLSNTIGAVYLIYYVLRRSKNFTLSPLPALQNPLAFGRILSIGLPNFVSSTLVGFAHAIANQLLVQYGTIAIAGMAAASKSTTMISMTQMGTAAGAQPLLSYNYGAKNLPRIREILKKLSVLTISIGLAMTSFCVLNQKTLVALFLKEPSALALGQQFIKLLVLTGPFLGLYYISTYFLQATGNAKLSTLVSLLRQGIFLLPFLYIMNWKFGMTGNIWAHIISDVLAAGIAVFLAIRQYKTIHKEFLKTQTT